MQNLHMTMHAQLNLIHIYDFYAKDLLTKKQNISSNNRRSELYPFCPCQITSRRQCADHLLVICGTHHLATMVSFTILYTLYK